jgi:hypothetical protein
MSGLGKLNFETVHISMASGHEQVGLFWRSSTGV